MMGLWRRSAVYFLLGWGLVLILEGGWWAKASWSQAVSPPPLGETLTIEAVAALVYEKLPSLPKENTYRRRENGEVASDHTLVSRLIRYHRDIQKRPTRYRLDWKLTLADYLGAYRPMELERYPGATTLQDNPLPKDTQVIQSLNRQQRDGLVAVLVAIYRPATPLTPPKAAAPAPASAPGRDPSKPLLSKPGDVKLLMP